ncbi:flagellar basal body-associated protein FliL [Thiomicrospira sp. WB1]|uniref:flagellar basal body-associated FliL family protein n=1 Tax=Thiomicrospira sp. WB1 TaxID=1685380 RepID=UPI000747DB15|nr:flagellar basal body-associated FliL family protein [Thiomicrospira sp. WB1]KUJ71650.1 flagellar basal body protein FliL [Thiomicrospira sp. WB1]
MAEENQEEQKSAGKGLMIALIVVILLLVIGIGVMTFLLLSGGDSKDNGNGQQANAQEQTIDDGVPREFSPKFKQYEPPEPGAPPQYFAMEPFVVNFKGEGQAKYLAVTLKFMSHYPQLVQDMENYRPILRNDITALLRKQTYSEMNLDNGPDILRERILTKARGVLEKHGIYPDILEDVFFERFVMQ